MRFLSSGTKGSDVKNLQQKLNILRFPCGREDGVYGPATVAAIVAFQKSHNIVHDGICGPETMTSLDLETEDDIQAAKNDHPIYNALSHVTIDKISDLFPQAPVRSIEAHFPILKDALINASLTDLKSVVVALSAIAAVSKSFSPHEEALTRLNTSPGGMPFDLYDCRRDLGNEGRPDGERFRSRGFCIFRGRFQYLRVGEIIGMSEQLIEQPDQAAKVSVASKILACLIESQEKNIKCALMQNNLKSAYLLITQDDDGFELFRTTYRTGMLTWG
ncbi:peptidoglycan-binding protein [Candidatus Magnetomorum sp. HK-1]|nr:peptidoglycan-binding protein [Candidatus Magnetomorum sp. HK-1]